LCLHFIFVIRNKALARDLAVTDGVGARDTDGSSSNDSVLTPDAGDSGTIGDSADCSVFFLKNVRILPLALPFLFDIFQSSARMKHRSTNHFSHSETRAVEFKR
jgi:hypothetical protein